MDYQFEKYLYRVSQATKMEGAWYMNAVTFCHLRKTGLLEERPYAILDRPVFIDPTLPSGRFQYRTPWIDAWDSPTVIETVEGFGH